MNNLHDVYEIAQYLEDEICSLDIIAQAEEEWDSFNHSLPAIENLVNKINLTEERKTVIFTSLQKAKEAVNKKSYLDLDEAIKEIQYNLAEGICEIK